MGALKPVAIEGPPGSGKTQLLIERAVDAARAGTPHEAIVVLTTDAQIPSIYERLRLLDEGADRITITAWSAFARSLLTFASDRTARHATLVDDVEASAIFEASCFPVADVQWPSSLGAEFDPEISGLSYPERFFSTAFALIGKLRHACIDPDAFERACLRGTTTFYANPPNFSDLDLMLATKDQHRSSLAADVAELERQRQREIHLTKLVAVLYRRYLDCFRGRLVPQRDAVPHAIDSFRSDPRGREAARRAVARAFVDDAHDCTAADFSLLTLLFGDELHGVTFTFDEMGRIGAFSGARPRLWKDLSAERVVLDANRRGEADIAALSFDFLTKATTIAPPAAGAAVTFYLAPDKEDEAGFVASHISALLDGGAPAGAVAVILRTLEQADSYVAALERKAVPIDVRGDTSAFRNAHALDVLAALWVAVDPYRHDWLLRLLQTAPLSFSDGVIALLCADAQGPQRSLFGDETETRAAESIPRTLRLARNVFETERDADVPDSVASALRLLRSLHAVWREALERRSPGGCARLVLGDLGVGAQPANDVIAAIDHYVSAHPQARLEDALIHLERGLDSALARAAGAPRPGCVAVLDASTARGLAFDHVFIANVRAGAFPRYYTPESFLFSPSLGLIGKDNAGEIRAARTAKYTYYEGHHKPAVLYYENERRLLHLAMTRARRTLTISAGGRLTRGASAPEFLNDLRSLRPEFALPR